MLRRVLLVVMATVASYVLTACSGYILYTMSEGRSEAHLSLMVRFLFNPLIALAVGVLVGLLSNDHPALTSVVGLTPWALMLRGPGRGGSVSGLRAWLGGMLVYFALGAVAAAFAWGSSVTNRQTDLDVEKPARDRATVLIPLWTYSPIALA